MTKYTLIVPTKIETAISGLLGAIEKTHRDRLFRVEFWNHGTVCQKNGAPIEWEKLPHVIRKAAHEGCEMLKQGQQLARQAQCHCGKDGHALNSVNCPVHGYDIREKMARDLANWEI